MKGTAKIWEGYLVLCLPVTDGMKRAALQEEHDYYATEESRRTHRINDSTRQYRGKGDHTRQGFLGESVYDLFRLVNKDLLPYIITSPRYQSTSTYWQKHKYDNKGGDTDFVADLQTQDTKTSDKPDKEVTLDVNAAALLRKPSDYYVLVWASFLRPLGYVLGFAPRDIVTTYKPIQIFPKEDTRFHRVTHIWPISLYPQRHRLDSIRPLSCTAIFEELLYTYERGPHALYDVKTVTKDVL